MAAFHRNIRRFGDLSQPSNRLALMEAILDYVRIAQSEKLGAEWIPGLRAALPELAGKSPPNYPGIVREMYGFLAANRACPRWGEKTPQYVGCMTDLLEMFPDAKFIHVVRDPRAVAASVLPLSFRPNTAWQAATNWVRLVNSALEFERANPGRVLRFRYEDLVTDSEKYCQLMCEFVNEPFDPGMLVYHKDASQRIVGGGHFDLVSSPPTKARIDRWKSRLRASQVRVIEAIAGETMAQFGYELTLTSARIRLHDRVLSALGETALLFRPGTKPANFRAHAKQFVQQTRFQLKYGFWSY